MAMLVALVLAGANADSWGRIENGFRMGVGAGVLEGEPAIRVVIENVSATKQRFLLGARTGKEPMYSIRYEGVAEDGRRVEVFCGCDEGMVAGWLEPLTVELSPGEQYELSFPRRKFWVSGKGTPKLTEFRPRLSSLRASQTVSTESAKKLQSSSGYSPSTAMYWTGTLVSGDLGLR